jgi:hypothetical protein
MSDSGMAAQFSATKGREARSLAACSGAGRSLNHDRKSSLRDAMGAADIAQHLRVFACQLLERQRGFAACAAPELHHARMRALGVHVHLRPCGGGAWIEAREEAPPARDFADCAQCAEPAVRRVDQLGFIDVEDLADSPADEIGALRAQQLHRRFVGGDDRRVVCQCNRAVVLQVHEFRARMKAQHDPLLEMPQEQVLLDQARREADERHRVGDRVARCLTA